MFESPNPKAFENRRGERQGQAAAGSGQVPYGSGLLAEGRADWNHAELHYQFLQIQVQLFGVAMIFENQIMVGRFKEPRLVGLHHVSRWQPSP